MEENSSAQIEPHIEVEQLSATSRKLSVKIPAEILRQELDAMYSEYRKHARIKGFRKGKVPEDQVRRLFKTEVEGEVSKRLVNQTLFSSLDKKSIVPLALPRLSDLRLQEGSDFCYSVIVDVKPDVQVKKYIGLELTKSEIVVDEAEVDQQIEAIRDGMATVREVTEDRPVSKGDVVEIDFEGFADEKPFAGGKAEKYSVQIGSDTLVADFETKLIGMKKGEKREVHLTFPEDYREESLRGKAAVFKVFLHTIKTKEVPPLDANFAEGAMGVKSVEEMKEAIRKHFREMKEREEKARQREEVVSMLIRENPVDAPEGLVERVVEGMKKDTERRMKEYGVPVRQEWDPRVIADYRKRATTDIQSAYLLEKIAEVEKIEVTDEDVEKRFGEIAEQTKRPLDEIKKHYRDKELELLKVNLRDEKSLEFIIEKAKIKKR